MYLATLNHIIDHEGIDKMLVTVSLQLTMLNLQSFTTGHWSIKCGAWKLCLNESQASISVSICLGYSVIIMVKLIYCRLCCTCVTHFIQIFYNIQWLLAILAVLLQMKVTYTQLSTWDIFYIQSVDVILKIEP